ncbi:hypothetical protein EJB05_29960 [Eragrostis curvula]|uniref:GDSL esterase/lipase n=1 Tax=Eragrostis curvula TaxID=38414 RepID=A0A5J9UUW6_9POAL|nr:hypothetical protein EJB05_29960 [Eragrostis curvula]
MTKPLVAGCLILVLLLNVGDVECRHRRDEDEDPVYKLFVFGDGAADNGNYPNAGLNQGSRAWYAPYGMSDDDNGNRPSGRLSDCLVQSDYLARILGYHESPPPYAAYRPRRRNNRTDQAGMNFANASAGVWYVGPKVSEQVDQFRSLINDGAITKQDLDNSVALIAVTGRDYSEIVDSASDGYVASFADVVTKEVARMVAQLQEVGVGKVVVNSLPPLGCTPWTASRFSDYDHCDARANSYSDAHNRALADKLRDMDDVMLLDVNMAFTELLKPGSGMSGSFKFSHGSRPCCEGKDKDSYCGQYDDGRRPRFDVCSNPDEYFFWDFIHPTDAGWAAVMQLFQRPIMRFLDISKFNNIVD